MTHRSALSSRALRLVTGDIFGASADFSGERAPRHAAATAAGGVETPLVPTGPIRFPSPELPLGTHWSAAKRAQAMTIAIGRASAEKHFTSAPNQIEAHPTLESVEPATPVRIRRLSPQSEKRFKRAWSQDFGRPWWGLRWRPGCKSGRPSSRDHMMTHPHCAWSRAPGAPDVGSRSELFEKNMVDRFLFGAGAAGPHQSFTVGR